MKRLPIVRHIRWFILSLRLAAWVRYCQRHGLAVFVNPSDEQYLNDVWSGKH